VVRGYELNYPLLASVVMPHPGAMGATHSFAQLEPANLVLTAIKKAEDDDGIIFRFYESGGRATEARLRLPAGAQSAVETNLIESEERVLPIANGVLTVPVRAYEIKAIKVRFAAATK